jgi:hypothetical protein
VDKGLAANLPSEVQRIRPKLAHLDSIDLKKEKQ